MFVVRVLLPIVPESPQVWSLSLPDLSCSRQNRCLRDWAQTNPVLPRGEPRVEQPTRIPSVCCWNKWTWHLHKGHPRHDEFHARASEAPRPREHPVSAEQLRELRQRWHDAPPMTERVLRQWWGNVRMRWNCHSTAIEGSSLSYGDTLDILVSRPNTECRMHGFAGSGPDPRA